MSIFMSFDEMKSAVQCGRYKLPCDAAGAAELQRVQMRYGWEGVFDLYRNQASYEEGDACTPGQRPTVPDPREEPKLPDPPPQNNPPIGPNAEALCEIRRQ